MKVTKVPVSDQPDIIEVLQPHLLYSWCYTLEGDILNVSDKSFTTEEKCRYDAECHVPQYNTCDSPDLPTYELHINTHSFPECPAEPIVPRFKWKHMLGNDTVTSDDIWYMDKESCRRKGLHDDSCEKADKLIVHEEGGKPLVIDLDKHVCNDLKYDPWQAPMTVYLFLLESHITLHMHPNEDWNLSVTNHLAAARRFVHACPDYFLYVCHLLNMCPNPDYVACIFSAYDINLIGNDEHLERYRLTIKKALDIDWCC